MTVPTPLTSARPAPPLPTHVRLTIGVIARNGLPFLNDCLASLPTHGALGGVLQIVLVDCASDDGTTAVMLDFARSRRDTRVFRVDGTANAAVARNVVLDNAGPGYLLLLDGDFVLEPDFPARAFQYIERGEAAAVAGTYREQLFDAENRPLGDVGWRHPPPAEPHPVRLTGGSIFLGPMARALNLRYDEHQRICEDWDFSLRTSAHCRILRVPEPVGTHLTHHYFSAKRWRSFYTDVRPRILGQLLRKHLAHPSCLASLLLSERGMALGGAMQVLAIAGLTTGTPWLTGLAVMILGADATRQLLKAPSAERGIRVAHWVSTRLPSPWMLVLGLIRPKPHQPKYSVRPIH
ncbi:MAG TPA: glycosyltransferase family 2 protein [Azospirillaceae bacterium]|nr:glycosyltransferase family 2 protein [Azospirillaceae bacterium]